MSEPPICYADFQRERALFERFLQTSDLLKLEDCRRREIYDVSWFMAVSRYMKITRLKQTPGLYEFSQKLLNESIPLTRELLVILRQCVYLFPGELDSLRFEYYLKQCLIQLVDPYLKYKYVRLLRLILRQIEQNLVMKILPPSNMFIEYFEQSDPSMMIFLENLTLIQVNGELQASLNLLYKRTLLEYLKSNDFDDDETIDLCSIILQINRRPILKCVHSNENIVIDFFSYINFDIETMINWLLTPETAEGFLIFILRIVKHYYAHRQNFQEQSNVQHTHKLEDMFKQLQKKLNDAHEKALFPYNIKPLLNAFRH